jgi:hypothetical protein
MYCRCGNPDMRTHGYCAVECGACATFTGTVAHKAPRKPPDRVAQPLSVAAPPVDQQQVDQQHAAQRQAARPSPKPTPRPTRKPTAPATAAASKTAASPTRAPTKAPTAAPAPTKGPTAAPTPAPSATHFTYSALVKNITDTHNAVRGKTYDTGKQLAFLQWRCPDCKQGSCTPIEQRSRTIVSPTKPLQVRAKHLETGPLKWNATMAASAQAYAEKCVHGSIEK